MTSIRLPLCGAFLLASVASAMGQATPPAKPPAPAPASKPAAAAPVSNEPTTTTASYGDWVLRCQKIEQAGLPPRVCEVAQSVQLQGQTAPIAQIAIGAPPKEGTRLTILLPNSVSFPSSVKVSTGEKDSFGIDLSWKRCLPGGCFAEAAPKDDILRNWRTQESGHITFTDGTGRDVKLPFSLRGLAPALDALAKG